MNRPLSEEDRRAQKADAKEKALYAKMAQERQQADANALRATQLKVIEQMQAEIAVGAKIRKVWDQRKKASAAFIDVSVFKSGLGPALDQYRSVLKGAYDVMRMHGELDAKGKKLVATSKAKVDDALKAYDRLAKAGQQRPLDKLSQAKGGKVDVATQKGVWKQIEKDMSDLQRHVDRWYKNVTETAEAQRKAMQGSYRPLQGR